MSPEDKIEFLGYIDNRGVGYCGSLFSLIRNNQEYIIVSREKAVSICPAPQKQTEDTKNNTSN